MVYRRKMIWCNVCKEISESNTCQACIDYIMAESMAGKSKTEIRMALFEKYDAILTSGQVAGLIGRNKPKGWKHAFLTTERQKQTSAVRRENTAAKTAQQIEILLADRAAKRIMAGLPEYDPDVHDHRDYSAGECCWIYGDPTPGSEWGRCGQPAVELHRQTRQFRPTRHLGAYCAGHHVQSKESAAQRDSRSANNAKRNIRKSPVAAGFLS